MSATTIDTISADAGIMLAEFSKLDKGSTVSYETICRWINREPSGDTKAYIQSRMTTVKKRLRKDHGKVIDNAIRSIGYKILTDKELHAGKAKRRRQKIHREARLSKNEQLTVDANNLSESERIVHFAEIAKSQEIENSTTDAAIKDSVKQIASNASPLMLSNLLTGILDSKNGKS